MRKVLGYTAGHRLVDHGNTGHVCAKRSRINHQSRLKRDLMSGQPVQFSTEEIRSLGDVMKRYIAALAERAVAKPLPGDTRQSV